MKKRCSTGKLKLNNQAGFTLIEMLIVLIVLGILAMIIIPQVSVSTEDAKLRTLQTNLNVMRSSIETYYAQHNSVYPGAINDATGSGAPADATAGAVAFVNQLTKYSLATGKAAGDSATLATTPPTPIFGPYIKGGGTMPPMNPFNNLNTITVDLTTTDISIARTADNTSGWKFYAKTGLFFANDSTEHAAY